MEKVLIRFKNGQIVVNNNVIKSGIFNDGVEKFYLKYKYEDSNKILYTEYVMDEIENVSIITLD